jgi:hypothetical protein
MARTASTYAQVVAAEGAKRLQRGESYFVPVHQNTKSSSQRRVKTWPAWRKLPSRGTSGARVHPLRGTTSPADSHRLATSMFVTPDMHGASQALSDMYNRKETGAAAGLLALQATPPVRRSARLAGKRR